MQVNCPISRKIVENGTRTGWIASLCLHNDVDIKIGIIYKNRKNRQNSLKLLGFWSIVFMQYVNRGVVRPF